MANSVVVDSEFLLEWCEYFGQPQVWYNSYVPQLPGVHKQYTGLLEWWNSGMVDWSVFVLVFIIYHIVSRVGTNSGMDYWNGMLD